MIVFVAEVTAPDGTVVSSFAKVHAAQGIVNVWGWDRDARALDLLATFPGTLIPAGFRQWTVDVPEVGTYRVADTGNCGCGHPLKHARLPRPVVA